MEKKGPPNEDSQLTCDVKSSDGEENGQDLTESQWERVLSPLKRRLVYDPSSSPEESHIPSRSSSHSYQDQSQDNLQEVTPEKTIIDEQIKRYNELQEEG